MSHHSQSYKVTVLIVTELQLSELLIHHSQSYSSHRYTSHSYLVTALTVIEEESTLLDSHSVVGLQSALHLMII